MGILRDSSGARIPLPTRLLVGRSSGADLTIKDKAVSGEHAVIVWVEDHWKVRDLSSRNGTFVNNRRVKVARLAEGYELQFGRRVRSWVLEDVGPPQAYAQRTGDDIVRLLADGMVCIPDAEQPLAMMFEDSDGEWKLELDGDRRSIKNRDTVTVAGESWTVFVPQDLGVTAVASSIMGVLVSDIGLDFRVSRDEELVNVDLLQGKRRTRLEARAHHYLLLTLARQRTADGLLPEDERGWVYRDDLESMLQLDSTHLNVQVYRARQELHRAGVADPGSIVERRGGRLRIGVRRLSIESM